MLGPSLSPVLTVPCELQKNVFYCRWVACSVMSEDLGDGIAQVPCVLPVVLFPCSVSRGERGPQISSSLWIRLFLLSPVRLPVLASSVLMLLCLVHTHVGLLFFSFTMRKRLLSPSNMLCLEVCFVWPMVTVGRGGGSCIPGCPGG